MKLTLAAFAVIFALVSADHENAMGNLDAKYHVMARASFNKIDTNNNAVIDKDEFWASWCRYDSNGDKELTESEYLTAMRMNTRLTTRFTPQQVTAAAKSIFTRMDTDKNGKITESDTTAAFNYLDKDDNKVLCMSEFSYVVLRMIQAFEA